MGSEETVPATLRRQLDIPHDRAIALGNEAVAVTLAGGYQAPGGRWVPLGPQCAAAVRRTVEYGPDDPIPPPAGHHADSQAVVVRNATTLAAARRLRDDGHADVAALNFASATHPGGGFRNGARAQEEYLARSSALYPCLRGRRMYAYCGKRLDPFYADFVIWSPDVPVFRDDDGALVEHPWPCTILTSPAVHAGGVRRYVPHREREIAPVMRRRARRVLAVAAAHGHPALVLGAWGCGAFGNDAGVVAGLFHELLRGEFAARFAAVVFAITDWSAERRFIGAFERVFGGGTADVRSSRP